MKDAPSIENIELFAGLSAQEAAALSRRMAMRQLAPGEILIEEGEAIDRLYFVIRGRLSVTLPRTATRPSEVRVAELGPGRAIGEYSAFDRYGASARVAAMEPVELLAIPANALIATLEERPALGIRVYRNLLTGLIRRLRAKDAELDFFQPL